jgi:AcrR family transcriptional regulator
VDRESHDCHRTAVPRLVLTGAGTHPVAGISGMRTGRGTPCVGPSVRSRARRGPGRPPAAETADTKVRIVRAAREAFSELGYDAATFDAIAPRAGLTRTAVNHYFSSKHELYQLVVEQTNALVIRSGVEKASTETTLLGQLEAFLAAATQADSEDRSAALFLMTSVFESRRHVELRETEHDGVTQTREFLIDAVTAAVARGELAAETNVSALVSLLLAILWGMAFYAGFVGTHQELEEVVDQLRQLLTRNVWQLSE